MPSHFDSLGKPRQHAGRAAITLVVVDDDPDALRATARILEEAGYNVITGASAAEAAALARLHRPAMLLLDVVLPDGSGLDVARCLKCEPDLAGVFVILLSGFKVSGEEQAAGLATGLADGYIARPFNKPEFLARIDALLRLRAAQALLWQALREKEALLKEVHHRVKNNLQLITSLLRLQAGRSREPETRAVLGEMQARIGSVALLHDTLHRSGCYARVRLADYLQQIAAHVFRAQNASTGEVRLALELAPAEVVPDQAIPCGLLVNELVTNCLKHAFPGGRAGTVRVSLEVVGGGPALRLAVADDGVGLPAGFELSKLHSLGLQLVSDLSEQLDGSLEIGPGAVGGAVFAATFTPQDSKVDSGR